MKILTIALILISLPLQALAEDHCDKYFEADEKFESAHHQYYSNGLEVTDEYVDRLNLYAMEYIKAYLGESPTRPEYGLAALLISLEDRDAWCFPYVTYWGDPNHVSNWLDRGPSLVNDGDYWKRLGGR